MGPYDYITNMAMCRDRSCTMCCPGINILQKKYSNTLMGSLLSCFFVWFSVGSSSRSRIIWPQEPARVVVQRRGLLKVTEPETISLRTLMETRCPSVLTPFEAIWWLFKYALGLLRHPRPPHLTNVQRSLADWICTRRRIISN